MNYQALAELLFPDVTGTPETLEQRYPERNLPEQAIVTRIGPSPTGFVHLGNLYNAVIGERLAHQSEGVFYLRIEDTDEKRKVEGAVETLISAMKYFGVEFDEGAETGGNYAPYYQRQRKEVYHIMAKYLTQQGKTYPCFLTAEEIDAIREQQTANKENPGIYGKYAEKNRNLTLEEIQENLSRGTGVAPVLAQCRTPDKQANDARYWIAATTTPLPGLANEVYLTAEQKKVITAEIIARIKK